MTASIEAQHGVEIDFSTLKVGTELQIIASGACNAVHTRDARLDQGQKVRFVSANNNGTILVKGITYSTDRFGGPRRYSRREWIFALRVEDVALALKEAPTNVAVTETAPKRVGESIAAIIGG